MSDERTTNGLSAEEIAEKVRARKQRAKWGNVFAVVGLIGFVLMAVGLFWTERAIGAGELTLLGIFVGMAAVGAGFGDPASLRAFWK